MLWTVLPVLGLLGVALVALGWRGRRVDDHPTCRKCRFDLVGLFPGAQQCPECGGSLERARAVRKGTYRRRRWAIGTGAGCHACMLLLAGALIWVQGSGFDVNSIKPVWLLVSEAKQADVTASDAALTELLRRLADDELDERQVDAVAEAALARQADRSEPWKAEWGDFLERCCLHKALSDEQLQRYARNAFHVTIAARPRIRHGDILPYELVVERRVASGSMLELLASHHGTRLAEQEITGAMTDFTVSYRGGFGLGTTLATRDRIALAPVKDGPWPSPRPDSDVKIVVDPGTHLLRSRWMLAVRFAESAGSSRRTWGPERPWDADPGWAGVEQTKPIPAEMERWGTGPEPAALARWRIEATCPMEVVDPGEQTTRLVTDESLRSAVEGSVSLYGLDVQISKGRVWANGNFGIALDAPIDMAFDVYWRDSGSEYLVGSVALPRNARSTESGHYRGELFLIEDRLIDVILRPSVEAASRTVGITEIWGDEIVFRGRSISTGRTGLYGGFPRFKNSFTEPETGKSFEVVAELVPEEEWPGGPTFRCAELLLPVVYILGRDGELCIYDIPEDDRMKSHLPIATIQDIGDGQDLEIVGQTLLCTRHGGLEAYSLADPRAPSHVSSARPEKRFHSNTLAISATRAVVLGRGSAAIYDITDPAQPALLTVSATGAAATGCVVGDHLFAGEMGAQDGKRRPGLRAYEISAGGELRAGGFVATAESPYHVFAIGTDRLIVSLDGPELSYSGDGVHGLAAIVDVSDPDQPRVIRTVEDCGGRAAAMLHAPNGPYLVCNGGIFKFENDDLVLVDPYTCDGSTLDGAPYHGDADGAAAALGIDSTAIVVRLRDR